MSKLNEVRNETIQTLLAWFESEEDSVLQTDYAKLRESDLSQPYRAAAIKVVAEVLGQPIVFEERNGATFIYWAFNDINEFYTAWCKVKGVSGVESKTFYVSDGDDPDGHDEDVLTEIAEWFGGIVSFNRNEYGHRMLVIQKGSNNV